MTHRIALSALSALLLPLLLGITNCEEQVLPPDHVGDGLAEKPDERVTPAEAAPAPAVEPVPGASMYQLDVPLTNHDGQSTTWAELQGEPVLTAFISTSCSTDCAMILKEVETIVDAVDGDDSPAKMKVLLISMDPARDTPEALKAYADLHSLDGRYVLARADEAHVRQIGAVLGTRFSQHPSGEFDHSPVIALLDAQGQLTGRMEGFGQQRGEIVERLRDLVE